jgi:hypothetical protein
MATFDLDADIPGEALGGDEVAAEWWLCGPSVLVGVGDTPEAASEHLEYLRRQCGVGAEHLARFEVGERVRVPLRAPDVFRAGEEATISARNLDELRGRFVGALRHRWLYLLSFADGTTAEVPEPFLRRVSSA